MSTNDRKNRVLVTGGAGFIGSVLVRLLLKEGYSITVLDSFLYNPDSLRDLGEAVTILRGDVRNTASVRDAVEGAYAVIHLAEIVGDPACDVDRLRTRDVNLRGTQIVTNTAKECGVEKFIYMSSCSVYGLAQSDRLYSEGDRLNPQSLYAELKVEAEQYVSSMADEKFCPTILRLSTVYGVSFRPRYDLFVNMLVARAVTERRILIEGGENWRPFIHVADIGRIILDMLKQPSDKSYGIFNAGHDSQNFTLMDVANMVHRSIPEAELVVLNQASSDRRSYRVDFSKLEETINFSPQCTVPLGVEELFGSVTVDTKYVDPMYSNVESARRIFDRNDPKKVVTMRERKTVQRYRDDMRNRPKPSEACALCAIPECDDFPHLKYWRVMRNQYPYDKVAETSWVLMPRRCVSEWGQLTSKERREYREFRLIAGDYGVNFFMWSTPVTQSVPTHYHEHLLRLYREK